MLEEDEFARVADLLSGGLRATKEFRESHGLPLDDIDTVTRFGPALAEFERLTGFTETNPNAIWHHRISLYGPPCRSCAKPLRTPEANICGACGAHREAV